MQLKLHVPARKTTTGTRGSTTISPSAATLEVSIVPAVGGTAVVSVFDVSTDSASVCTGNPDGSRDCAFSLTAPVGIDTFNVTLFDQPPAGGSVPSGSAVLGSTTVQQTIAANQINALSFTIGGQVASIQITPAQLFFTQGTSGTASVYVVALDADGNIITGTDSYANVIAVQSVGPFTLQLGTVTSTQVLLTSPAQNTVSVLYNGSSFGSTNQVSASANGTVPAVATITNSTGGGSGTVTVPGHASGKLVAIDSLGIGGTTLVGIPAGANTSTVAMSSQPVSMPSVSSISIDSSGTGTMYAVIPGTAAIDVLHVDANNPDLIGLIGVITGAPTQLTSPQALAVDTSGNLYVADQGNTHAVPGGAIEKYAPSSSGGSPSPALYFYGAANLLNGSGPTSISVDSAGDIFTYVSSHGTVEFPNGHPGASASSPFTTDIAGYSGSSISVTSDGGTLYATDQQRISGSYYFLSAYSVPDPNATPNPSPTATPNPANSPFAKWMYHYYQAYGAASGLAQDSGKILLETATGATRTPSAPWRVKSRAEPIPRLPSPRFTGTQR